MKKIIALVLSMMMIVCSVACTSVFASGPSNFVFGDGTGTIAATSDEFTVDVVMNSFPQSMTQLDALQIGWNLNGIEYVSGVNKMPGAALTGGAAALLFNYSSGSFTQAQLNELAGKVIATVTFKKTAANTGNTGSLEISNESMINYTEEAGNEFYYEDGDVTMDGFTVNFGGQNPPGGSASNFYFGDGTGSVTATTDEFTVDVVMDSFPQSMTQLDALQIGWNLTGIEYVSGVNKMPGAALTGGAAALLFNYSSGSFTQAQLNELAGKVIATVTFKKTAANTGNTGSLEISNESMINYTEEAGNEFYYEDGDVTMDGFTVTFSGVTPPPTTYTVTFYDEDGTTVLGTAAGITSGGTAVYPNATPTKNPDAQYTYAFEKWVTMDGTADAVLTNVTSNFSVKAKYTATPKQSGSTSNFYFGDGTGTIAATSDEFTVDVVMNSFPQSMTQLDALQIGWNLTGIEYVSGVNKMPGAALTGGAAALLFNYSSGSFTQAQLNELAGKVIATVTFKKTAANTGNTGSLEISNESMINYTEEAGNEFYYEDGDVTMDGFTVTFSGVTPPPTTYTVTFYDEDGTTVLGTAAGITSGGTAVYPNATPTKNPDAQYTYAFEKWVTMDGTADAVLTNVTSNFSVKAKYTPTEKKFTVNFYDEDGTTLLGTASDIAYNGTATYPNATPTKNPDAQYTYAFEKWVTMDGTADAVLTNVTSNFSVKAKYTPTEKKFTVNFYDEDGTTLLGTASDIAYNGTATYPNATPTKVEDNANTYAFEKWVTMDGTADAVLTNVTTNYSVKAKYIATAKKYTVTFYDEDGTTLLGTDTEVLYQGVATYPNAIPTKAEDDDYTYTFEKWVTMDGTADANLTSVTGNISVKAKYTATPKSPDVVTVTFYDEDGTTVLGTANVVKDKMTIYKAANSIGLEKVGYEMTFANVDNGTEIAEDVIVADNMDIVVIYTRKSSGGSSSGVTRAGKNTPITSDDETTPDETTPDETTPDETIPDETIPDESGDDVIGQDQEIKGFVDVKEEYGWAKASIDKLAEMGIINGKGDNVYDPAGTINRAETAKLLTLVFDLVAGENVTTAKDVDADAWYKPYIDTVSSLEIMTGYEDGTIKPEAAISRQEIAVLIARALGDEIISAVDTSSVKDFADEVSIADWAKDSVKKLVALGIFKGDDANNFNAEANLTRAEAAVLFDRLQTFKAALDAVVEE